MAFPMIHLLVASGWAADRAELSDCPEYYLGALAPDAIHMRDDIRYPQDKIVTHLNALPATEFATGDFAAYWRARTAPFDIGYGIHILTDVLWVRFYKFTYPTLIVGGHTDNARYYPDVARIDERLYAERADRARICALLARSSAPDNHPLLTCAEILGWRDRVAHSFAGESGDTSLKVFSHADIDRFIETSARGIEALLRHALDNSVS